MKASAGEPCPRLRPAVDAARLDGEEVFCLYDRDDPAANQVVLSAAGVVLASLLDGSRTPAAVRAAFARQTGARIAASEFDQFVAQLDAANLLDSPRYHTRLERQRDEFRARPTRAAVHAGGAYPGDPDALRQFLDARYTMAGGPGRRPGPVTRPCLRGLIAPHIDLHRGGHSYAWGYAALAECEPADLYVLLGTCHQPMSYPFAATARPYDTPFGPVGADSAFLERLARRAPFDIFGAELSHRQEHSLEFQAVYLRYLEHSGGAGSAAVVPILAVPPYRLPDDATPRDDPATEEFLAALAETIDEDGRRVCFIAGADFAHVGPQFGDTARVDRRFAERVRAGDLAMLERIAAGDADGYYHQVVDEQPGPGMAGESHAVGGPRRICGLAPMYALLRLLGPSTGEVLHYDQWIDRDGAGSVTFGCVAFR
ncbi:MAG: AmmeMemoRadiSam system protein B [Chloroflexi bacterium]|nr:AmmeMemoRadiSam system protein B [Chloroflexota bacterium]